jgi:diguanylate cyclase (GGDEF)-like protein
MANLEETIMQRPNTVAAGASAVVLMAVVALTLPVAEEPWGERAWVVAALLAGVALLDGLTALLLSLRVRAYRELPLAWFAGGYAFTAILVFFHLLSFPGVAVPRSATPVGQVSAWLWIFWHMGLPVFVLLAMSELTRQGRGETPAPRARSALAPIFVGIGAALALSLLAEAVQGSLPALIDREDDYRGLVGGTVGQVVVVLNLIALARLVYATQLRSIVYQWLALALLAFNFDALLSLAGSERFTAGWYMARLMSVLASGSMLVALMVEHFRLLRAAHDRADMLDDLAHRDGLTELFNRRYFEAHLTHEFQRAKRYGHDLSVLLIDLDHFKSVNDRYGHIAGDLCLKAVAGVLASRVKRAGEFAARYGGEEFVVVLPEIPNAAAQALAEEIRAETETLHAVRRAPYPVTVSVGVATLNPRDIEQGFSALLSAADTCLYQAKKEGRNRVVATELGRGEARPQLQVVA